MISRACGNPVIYCVFRYKQTGHITFFNFSIILENSVDPDQVASELVSS